MSADPTPTRPPQLTGSTATIIALLSMATMVTSNPGAMAGRVLPAESRPISTETASVREMAVAMVAAAARNLLASERIDTALPAPLFAPVRAATTSVVRVDARDSAPPVGYVLHERLIDLPPPGC